MNAKFQIEFRKSNGNLHIRPQGTFDGSSASQLVNLLYEKYDGRGRVFIDTQDLRDICPFGCDAFKCQLKMTPLPPACLYFKGEKGRQIAPDGSRIIVQSRRRYCGCNGNCKQCICRKGNRN